MEEKVILNKSEDADMSFKDFILTFGKWKRYLISKWIIITIFVVLGGVIGLTYAFLKKPIYSAVTTFVLEDSDKAGGGLGQYAGLASMVGVDIGGGGGGGIFQGDNILELYKSRKMIEKTLLTEVKFGNKKELLINRYIDINGLRKKWNSKPQLRKIDFKAQNLSFTRLQDSVLGFIVKDISKSYLDVSKPDKKLSIIRAEVKSTDELFAKLFNEEIVKNVNDFYVQTKVKKSSDNVIILQQKTDSVRAAINGSIYTAASVTDATPNLNPTRQVQRSAPVQRSQVSVEANKIMLGELLKNLELSKISLRKESPLIQVVDQPILPLDKDSLSKLKSLIVGAVLAGSITCLFLIVRRVFKTLLD